MKAYLSLLLTSALLVGATSLAFGEAQKKENTGHKSHSSTHHRSTGSHKSGNAGSKTSSNVPSN